MSIWFERNGITGTTETAPAGHVVYVVTAANGASMRTDVGSLARSVAIEWSVCPPPAPQMASPLPVAERCSSGLSGGFTAMSRPVRDMLADAERRGDVQRGRHLDGNYSITMLKSAARRGWLELDDKIRPSWGRLTDAGRKALARYNATTVGAR